MITVVKYDMLIKQDASTNKKEEESLVFPNKLFVIMHSSGHLNFNNGFHVIITHGGSFSTMHSAGPRDKTQTDNIEQ